MLAKIIDRIRKGSKFRHRDAISGRYVSWIYAKLNPSTTVRETVR